MARSYPCGCIDGMPLLGSRKCSVSNVDLSFVIANRTSYLLKSTLHFNIKSLGCVVHGLDAEWSTNRTQLLLDPDSGSVMPVVLDDCSMRWCRLDGKHIGQQLEFCSGPTLAPGLS